MREILLSKGVDPDRLELDEESQDTLQNVIAAARFIRAQRLDGAVICTDDYHAPRVSMLFRGLGVPTELGPIGNDLRTKDFAAWSLAAAREVAAYAYDFAVISHRRPSLLRMMSQG